MHLYIQYSSFIENQNTIETHWTLMHYDEYCRCMSVSRYWDVVRIHIYSVKVKPSAVDLTWLVVGVIPQHVTAIVILGG